MTSQILTFRARIVMLLRMRVRTDLRDVFFFSKTICVSSLGSRKKDQRRRTESGQTENDGHGTQEDRRVVSSAVRAVRILLDERPQQTARAVLTRRRH